MLRTAAVTRCHRGHRHVTTSFLQQQQCPSALELDVVWVGVQGQHAGRRGHGELLGGNEQSQRGGLSARENSIKNLDHSVAFVSAACIPAHNLLVEDCQVNLYFFAKMFWRALDNRCTLPPKGTHW